MSGSNYFKALMRSAGAPPKAGRSLHAELMPASATPEVFDPFEAAEAVNAADASPRSERLDMADAPTPAQIPARPQALPAAPVPLQAKESLPAALARDAHPAVQAALRWVTAAPTEPGTGPASPEPVPAMAARPSPDSATFEPHSAARPSEPLAITRVGHIEAQATQPETPRSTRKPERREERPAAPDPASVVQLKQHSSNPMVTSTPTRVHTSEQNERPSTNKRAEVHIGTLHVTLDAAATARFGTLTVAAPALEAPRPAAPGNARSAARQAAGSSPLSRSRLPRW